MKKLGPNLAFRIILLYVVLSGVWILLSDHILMSLVSDVDTLTRLQTYKGWGFVGASALLLYYLVRRDQLERDRVEQSLRQSEARYRTLVEQASDGIFIVDLDGNPIDVNQSACAMLGYTREEILQLNVMELLPEKDLSAMELHMNKLRAGKTVLTERDLIRKDGTSLPVEVSTKMLSDGRLQGIVRDITERREAEQAMRTWADIFQNIKMGVAIGGPDGKLLNMINHTFASMHGYTVEELVCKPITTVFAPEERSQVPEYIHTAHEKGHHVFESTHICKDGSILPVQVDVTAVKDEKGEVLYRIASVQDISERKRSERNIQSQMERLAALRKIDIAITSTLDLRITFDVLLEQIINQLKVDAAAVLLFNDKTQRLEYAAGRGFLTTMVQNCSMGPGQGVAGRVLVERRIISIPDLSEIEEPFLRSEMVKAEGFIAYHAVPLIAKGVVKGILEIYHREPLPRDPDWLGFLESLSGQAAIAVDNMKLYEDLQRSTLELVQAYDATLEGWSRALELRDRETEGHTRRVTSMTLNLAREMGMKDTELVHVRRGTLLHDIGKMGIPDNVLLKPGPLTPDEWEIMRRHPVYAFEMLLPIPYLRPALDIPYCHHERWDGTGYPRGLKGEQIPLAARIFSVVDVWDALRSIRPYRPAWPVPRVRKYLTDKSGTHFDPRVVEAFLDTMLEQ